MVPKTYLNGFVVKSTLIFAVGSVVTTIVLSLSPPERVLSYADSFRLISDLSRVIVDKSLLLFSITFLFMLVGIVILSIVYSHRVAGALHKLGLHTRAMTSGDFTQPIHLRKSDVVHELASDLNDFSGLHSGLLTRVHLRLRDFETILNIANHSQAPRKESIRELAERIEEIRNLLNQIKP